MSTSVSQHTVVNVNDNERSLYLVSKMLKSHGYSVLEAHNGREALSLVEKSPSVMVLDVCLPDISGYEVCRLIKQNDRTSSIKVLHTSATSVMAEKKVHGLPMGADGYLTQPFEVEELVATVDALIRLKEAESELRERAERLAEQDRRKDEFLAMLAHELRNPLAALSASLPLLQRFGVRDDKEMRALDIIARQTRHLGRLVDDLLDVARVTRGHILLHHEPVNLGSLLERVSRNAEPIIQSRGQRLVLQLPSEPLHVKGDITRLEQVFTNLVDNASKYTDRGGALTLRLMSAGDSGGAWASVTVKDTGIGIAPEALGEIFSLFTQTGVSIARSRGGLGIGLTLVRTLVELHGGTVVARSEGLGQGSEFEVRLPAVTFTVAPKPPPMSNEQGLATTASTRRRILIVEDNSDARQALQDLCELWGHQVEVAPDGLTGVQAAQSDEGFDYALIDIGLPGIDGYEVARRLRAMGGISAHTRLVALTGYGSPEQRALALASGFDVHLVKPVDSQKLFQLLATDPQQFAA